ncbi:MAG: 50S ribosomal protein L23 [Tepidisphaeraceae bacterium]|jgi:large subunit ribosomal protein L23
MEATNVIIRPLITEKSTRQQHAQNTYSFEVNADAGKKDIKEAVEKLYSVKVSDVRTLVRKGKPRRTRYRLVHTKTWKRAIVKLQEDSRIDLF